uniref:Arf-GAP with dual PH domain-containing protein 1 n=1 Tax=Cacopsylla melanoneura TaxID=428564 RepID=A0A8D8W1J0_9HEMI
MVDSNGRAVLELLKLPGNDVCVDCSSKNPEFASYNLGVFLCARCASIHKTLGVHISKIKHLKLDGWEDSQLERMRLTGNNASKMKYEMRVPVSYKVPTPNCPQVLLKEWVRSKYEREEFRHPEALTYITGHMDGFLMKRGKESGKYHPRRFVLNEVNDTIKYYVKEKKEPKATLRISELNVVISPSKINHPHSLQLTFMREGSTRHIYVYHEESQTIMNWYHAIRNAKLHRLQVAFPSANDCELVKLLTRDFGREGWLWKTGPKNADAYRKRWFTLDYRKLMYHEEPLSAYPKGEIFLGHNSDGYTVRLGVPPGAKDQGFTFTLKTPQRWYTFSALSAPDRDQWIDEIQKVIDTPLTPQDHFTAAQLVRKRNAGIFGTR